MTRSQLLVTLILISASAAHAQSAPDPEELLALTFYYQQKDEASIRSELQRLQLLYPAWQPPEDLARLTQGGPGAEIDIIFRQIGAGQLNEARATIEQTQNAFPEWTPPAEMLALLETKEGQSLLDAALEAGDLSRALTLAGERPSLLRCDRVNNAWRIAETQQSADLPDDALGTYRAVLSACVDPSDIVATLEKASAIASPEDLRGLVGQAVARFPELTATLLEVQDRLLGGETTGVGVISQSQGTAASPGTNSFAATEQAPAAQAPVAPAPDPTPAPVAAPSSTPKPAARSEAASKALSTSSGTAKSSAGIHQQAWQTYNLDRPMEAIAMFETALRGRLDATQRRDAQYGIALSYLKVGMADNASRIAAAADLSRKQRVDVERQILDQRGVAAYNRRDFRRAIEFFDALQGLTGSLRRDLDVLRAYAYLNSNRRDRARQEFMRLHNQLATAETRRGLAALD